MKNKQKLLVSTLICTYNAEKFFKGTIESVLDQTYKNQEILIWDDGSTDNTINIIKEYQEKDNRIKLWTSKDLGKKLGPYGGLNFLIDKSSGEFIAIQDHDDIWHPKKLEKQVKFLNENKDYIGCGHNVLVFFEKKEKGYIFKSSQKNHVMHTSLMFKNLGLKYRNDNNIFLEDLYFQKKILLPYGDIYNIDEVLSLHLIKNKNLSREWGKLNLENIKKIIELYGLKIYGIQILLVFILKKIFPNYFKKKEQKLLNIKYGILSKYELIKNNRFKILLNYLNNTKD